jgi:ATP-dependent RNA helicase DeaD|tara:strand:- start:8734 stop:10251 length:1518 start_codon:yes stop_codon:yes gene_type:complete
VIDGRQNRNTDSRPTRSKSDSRRDNRGGDRSQDDRSPREEFRERRDDRPARRPRSESPNSFASERTPRRSRNEDRYAKPEYSETREEAKAPAALRSDRTPVRGKPVRRRDEERQPDKEILTQVRTDLVGTEEWGGLKLEKTIVNSISNMGYESPSEIQEVSIPWQLEGRDVVAQAVTGSGKTAAFGIPMCNQVDPNSRDVQGLVLVPTRELAQQVQRELALIGRDRGISVVAVYGGEPIAKQIRALEKSATIVVGTPGRLKDLMNRRIIDLGYVRYAVLDEADEMLDIGFADDMEFILKRTPSTRQTALFSATIPGFIRGLIRRYLDDPRWIQLVNDSKGIETVDEVDQIFYDVASQDKADGILEILDDVTEGSQVLIFRKMQVGVDRLSKGLAGEGFGIKGIHGGMSQSERNRVMNAFRDGSLRMLVATNLAARGLDIPTISHVINYDMPENIEEYVHRIGRTARMGKRGTAVSFIGEWDFELHEQIVAKIGEDKMIRKKFSFY